MHTRPTRRGEEEADVETIPRSAGTRLTIAASLLAAMLIPAFAGCAQAEKTRYVRHLTTVVQPSAEVPEEAMLTFDIDRKRLRGAVAVGSER